MRLLVPGSMSSPSLARFACRPSAGASRSMGVAMLTASGPDRRTTPMPPRPGGVAMATMVSSRCMGLDYSPRVHGPNNIAEKGILRLRQHKRRAAFAQDDTPRELYKRRLSPPRGRLWRGWFALVVLGIDDHVTLQRFAGAFGAQVFLIAQGQVHDATLAR